MSGHSRGVLGAETLELVRTIASREPPSVRELAQHVNRDLATVATHIEELAERGFVDLQEEGDAKRPIVWYDHLEIDIPVSGGTN
ncbi:MAG: MarR family transcriptional regulator [Natrialbaceae archaeon]|nr:MarR family transcriptional regulator [Natrialbaceae archaeon]